MKAAKLLLLSVSVFSFLSCSSFLKYQKTKEFENKEFEKKVVIVETEAPKEDAPEAGPAPAPAPEAAKEEVKTAKKPVAKKAVKKKTAKAAVVAVPLTRQPDIEDSDGFENQRRPPTDPFRVGEKVVHAVTYLGATAGHLTLSVKPFAVVNGKKSYNFNIEVKSTSFFSKVFAVDDEIQTYVDFESLVPHAYKLNIHDAYQVKEAQSYFDNESLRADYWEHKFTEKGGHEEKKQNWAILPYSQNPFSAIFYMRVFNWTVGKDYVFRVADDEKNVEFKAHALGKEVLNTEAGTFNTIKLKAEVVSRGKLKATDFYLWISDDSRKYVLRIDVKLPVGTLTSEAIKIQEGK